MTKWHLIAAFVAGLAIGSFVLPYPRYSFYRCFARDHWTGEVKAPLEQNH